MSLRDAPPDHARVRASEAPRLRHLRSILATGQGMLARMRLGESDFDIEETGDKTTFVRKDGLKMGHFWLFGSTFLVTRFEARNPTSQEMEANEYERSKVVYVQAIADERIGPQFQLLADGSFVVFSVTGERFDAIERAQGYGDPTDILAAVCASSVAHVFLARNPPQTAPPPRKKLGVLGI